MAQTVKLKRSNTAGTIPTTSNLALGEVAINTKDGKFFIRKHVDGSTGDAIHAYAPQGINAYGTQELVVKVVTKTTAHPNNGSGSSNGYTVQGLEGPFLALIPGNTYKFDVSDSTNSGHPFRFYLDAAKATAYTTGVTTNGSAGNSGAYVQIAVTTSTPQVLYYQCSSHSLMGSAAYVASDAIAANAVGSTQIAQNSITSAEIPDNSIGSTQISAAVLAAKQDNLGNNSITAAMISQNTVGISELNVSDGSANQVLTTDGSGTLSFANPSSGTVTETFKTISVSGQSDVVADGATDTLTLAGSGGMTITTTAGTDTVTFSSSTTPADDSVVTAKIADLNVTAAKLANNSVTAAKIATSAVGISELAVTDGSNGQVLSTDGSGTLSFVNNSGGGGSQNLFQTVAVSGQSNVVADSTTDTLTLAAGSGMTITTDASSDTITFASSGGSASDSFKTISVAGQSDVVADSSTDTLTLIAGSNVTLTTDATNDRVTINTTPPSGGSYSFANMSLNEFTGNGSTTAFTLGQTPGAENNLIVFNNGVYQNKDAFTLSGATLTFDTAPANGNKIIAYVTADAPTVALGSTTFTDQFTTSNASTTAFTLSKTVPNETNLMVFVDAAYQSHDDLSLSGTTLTLATAPPSGAVVTVHGFSGAAIGNTPTLSTFTGDGSTTGFTLGTDPLSENNTNVYIDGVYQNKSTYTVSGTTLTFSTAPPASTAIEVHMLTIQSMAENSIVSGSLAANSVSSTNIAQNAVGSSELAATSVTAGSYGSSSAIPVLTIDTDGRVTAASTATTSTTLTVAADSGSNDTVTVGTDTLTFAGTSNEVETTVSNNQIQIGLPTNPTVGGNLTVTGNLTVNGSTTTVSTANMTVEDNLIELNTGASSNANDAGIVIERGSTGDNAIFAWDESADKFIVGTTTATGASTGNLTITAAPLVTGALTSSSASIASLAYPTSDGSNGQALVTNGSGTLSFATVSVDGAVIDTYSSSGNGSTTAFDTSITIADEKNTWVFVDGVYQPKDTYSTSGSTVTFSAAPPNGADVEVLIGKVAGFDSADTILGTYSTTTSGTGYSTGISFTNENNTFLFIDGIYQPKNTYSVSGSTLTLDADPVDGLDLELVATKTLSASAVETAFIAANAVTGAKIASNAVGSTEIAQNSIGSSELNPAALASQTMTGNVNFSGTVNIDSNTLVVDSANNRVGIGTASPSQVLDVNGYIKATRIGAGISPIVPCEVLSTGTTSTALRVLKSGSDDSTQNNLFSVTEISGHGRLSIHDSSQNEDIRLDSNGNSYFNGGNVGIGTASPGQNLTVSSSGVTYSRVATSSSTGAGVQEVVNSDGDGISTISYSNSASGTLFGVNRADKTFIDSNQETVIGTSGSKFLILATNSTERMRIASNGNVAIGTTDTSDVRFRVDQNENDDHTAFFKNTCAANAIVGITYKTDNTSNASNKFGFQIDDNGNERFAARMNGDVYSATGSFSSDIRLKENIEDCEPMLEKLKQVRIVDFDWIGDVGPEGRQRGVIAQEIELIFPELIQQPHEYKELKKSEITPILIKAIQEQQTIIEDLKARIETLEGGE